MRWGLQVAGGRAGSVNIAPGLGLGPLAFMASQENKSPQETRCGAHTCVHVCFCRTMRRKVFHTVTVQNSFSRVLTVVSEVSSSV